MDTESITALPLLELAERGHIVSYTVVSRRDKADIGIILGATHSGERFLASTIEPATTLAMQNSNPIGKSVTVQMTNERPVFSFRSE